MGAYLESFLRQIERSVTSSFRQAPAAPRPVHFKVGIVV